MQFSCEHTSINFCHLPILCISWNLTKKPNIICRIQQTRLVRTNLHKLHQLLCTLDIDYQTFSKVYSHSTHQISIANLLLSCCRITKTLKTNQSEKTSTQPYQIPFPCFTHTHPRCKKPCLVATFLNSNSSYNHQQCLAWHANYIPTRSLRALNILFKYASCLLSPKQATSKVSLVDAISKPSLGSAPRSRVQLNIEALTHT